MKQEIFKELSNYKKILEEKGYNVIYIGLYGSQNYNLNDEESDIDVKAIIMPSLHDIIFRKVTSTTVECEKGNIDVKDLLTFYDVIKKGNLECITIDEQYMMACSGLYFNDIDLTKTGLLITKTKLKAKKMEELVCN